MLPPQRIVSLVPSLTELLSELALDEDVVGITSFCIHPDQWFRSKRRVGGTKTVHINRVRDLQPTLIIASKEENVREQVEALQAFAPVLVTDVTDLQSALDTIREIGVLTGRSEQAAPLVEKITAGFARFSPGAAIPCAYFIWRNPWMVAGGDTFINDMLIKAGFQNIFAHRNRYPAIDAQTLKDSGCPLILLSSEPYPFRKSHTGEIRAVLPEAILQLVDGEMFSWYGSRLQYAPGYFQQLRQDMLY